MCSESPLKIQQTYENFIITFVYGIKSIAVKLIPPTASLLVTKYRPHRVVNIAELSVVTCASSREFRRNNAPALFSPHPRLAGKCSAVPCPVAWTARWMGSWDGLVSWSWSPHRTGDDSEWVVACWMFTGGHCLTASTRLSAARRCLLQLIWGAQGVDMFDLSASRRTDLVNCTGNSFTPMSTGRSMPTATTFGEVQSSGCNQRSLFASDDDVHTIDRTRPTTVCWIAC